MNLEAAKQTFSNYINTHLPGMNVDTYNTTPYKGDAVLFSTESEKRPNPMYMVRGDKVAELNPAFRTIEKVYADLA